MGRFNHSKAGSSTANSCRCEEIEKKLNEAKKKLKKVFAKLDKLKKAAVKKVAKKVATLPLKAVPIFGWAMAIYDVYDVVTTGIDIADVVEKFNKEAGIVNKLSDKLDACLGKKDKKVDLNDPKSMKDKTSKEIGDDLTDKDGKHKLSKNKEAEAEYAKEGNSDVDIYTKGEKGKQGTKVTVNKGDGLHTDGAKTDKPTYVKVDQPNKPNTKYVDTERYNTGKNNAGADKRSEVIDINTGETISKKGETYSQSSTHDWDRTTGKLTPKGDK